MTPRQSRKIALAFPAVHRRGGVERITLECARYLAEKGHHVDVFANEWEGSAASDAEHDGIHYRYVPALRSIRFLAGVSYFRNASRRLDIRKYDAFGTFGCVCPVGGVQWVQSVHRAWLERSRLFRRRFSKGWWKQRLNPAHRLILRLEAWHFRPGNYRKLIALTPEVKSDLMRLYAVPADDIVLLANGYSPQEFNPARAAELRPAVRRELKCAEADRIVLFVANELERKGFAPLLRGCRAGRSDGPPGGGGSFRAGGICRRGGAPGLGRPRAFSGFDIGSGPVLRGCQRLRASDAIRGVGPGDRRGAGQRRAGVDKPNRGRCRRRARRTHRRIIGRPGGRRGNQPETSIAVERGLHRAHREEPRLSPGRLANMPGRACWQNMKTFY